VAICMCHEPVQGLETERSPLRPRACGIVYLLTSNSTGRRLHLLNAVLKVYYSTGASLNICNDSVMHFRSFSSKCNINTLVTVTDKIQRQELYLLLSNMSFLICS